MRFVGLVGRDDDDHADAAVEGAQPARRRSIAADFRHPAEHRKQRPCAGVERHAQPFGQHARDVVGQAAAGDVGKRLDRRRPRTAASSGLT